MEIQDDKSYTSKDLTKVAAQGAVEHILVGSYTKAGDTFRINISLQEAHTGELVVSLSTEGNGEASIFSMVDDLTKRIKSNLKLSLDQLTSDLDKEVGKITTSSPEAFKLYREGRDFHHKIEYEQSIALMEKAIAFDPEFAMAYRSLAASYGNLSKYDEQKMYRQKAIDLSDRLTEHEKLLIEGDFYRDSDSTYHEAIEAYENVLKLYPEDTVVTHNLALIYDNIEDWDKAIIYYEAAIQGKTNFVLTYTQLAQAYMAIGQYDKAKEVYEDCIRKFPDAVQGYHGKSRLFAVQGQYDLALKEMDNAAAINPLYTRAMIYFLTGDFAQVEAGYKKWLGQANQSWYLNARKWLENLYRAQGKFKEAESQILQGIDLVEKRGTSNRVGYKRLAYLHLTLRNTEKALEAFEKAWDIGEKDPRRDYKIPDLMLKGWIFTEMGRLDGAQLAAEEIKDLVASSLYKKEIRNYYILLGMIELKNKNYPDAVDHFKKAISYLNYQNFWGGDHAFYIYYLALAYYESGALDKARDEFEEITTLTVGRMSYGDIYAKSFYMLGKIHEQQGKTAKAIENYEKFLSLWKDADPGLPEVDDAKKRLAGLKQ
jgi:tetratricopeptide (TPR) repeat protein